MRKPFPALLPLALCFASFGFASSDNPAPYNGAQSGALECAGAPIPQNAEYVFRNVPLVKMRLDYEKKIWEVRFAAGDAQTQRLILKNISNGPQKHCLVHWTVIP